MAFQATRDQARPVSNKLAPNTNNTQPIRDNIRKYVVESSDRTLNGFDGLAELWPLLERFFGETGIDRPGVPEFQRKLFTQKDPLLTKFEVAFVRALSRRFKSDCRFFEIGSGIGLLPIAAARFGYQVAGIEADKDRHTVAESIHAYLRQARFPGIDRATFVSRRLPAGSEPFLEHNIPIVSNIVFSPQYVSYENWFQFLARYPVAIVNLARFIERRSTAAEETALLAQFHDAGLCFEEILYEDQRNGWKFAVLVHQDIAWLERVDRAIAAGNADILTTELADATPARRETLLRRLKEPEHHLLRSRLLRDNNVWKSAAARDEAMNGHWHLDRATEPPPEPAPRPAGLIDIHDRYGRFFIDASRKAGTGRDILWFGVIDWTFRIQRPQHLSRHLAAAGARVFYISITFETADERGRFQVIAHPHPGVYEVKLHLDCELPQSFYRGFTERQVYELQAALDEAIVALHIAAPVAVLNHPNWHAVACGIAGATVAYDCLDFTMGFNAIPASVADREAELVATADLVVVASQPLGDHLAANRSSVIVRNASDFDMFAAAFSEAKAGAHPVIGYFGAISEWFEIDWIVRCARARPDWNFRLIGHPLGVDIAEAEALPNVTFLGELPYVDLPEHLRLFDVAVIPFRLTELIKCTNPVKLYEYMAAGKPVVASRMPEVVNATDMVYLADDAASFEERIAEALRDDDIAKRRARQDWAREHCWPKRAAQFSTALDALFPLVSVIVLTHNNWPFTEACLHSLRQWSEYPNLEIIVVDNASSDQTRDRLADLARQDGRVRVILNDENLGFAAGNNVGLRAARGEYLVILNNDTYVTRGWIRDLIRPMQLDPRIGLAGPLTNNIGNEQKIKIAYRNMEEMAREARRRTRLRLRRTFEIKCLAFFCVAIRRAVIEEVGLLDEAYGLGFFEDDDYCVRARQAGYKLVVADDVFVHHELSASFAVLGAEKKAAQMAANKAIFERRWGPWEPHRYRDEPGFG